MNTIYLTGSQFGDFINKKYYNIKDSSFKIGTTKLFAISYNSDSKTNKDVLFFSDINEITIPDKDVIPHLNTHYGIPNGLIKYVQSDKVKYNNIKFDSVSTPVDELYLGIRRALLYATVWTMKKIDSDDVKESIELLLSEKTRDFIYKFSEKIIIGKQYPERKPEVKSLDDQQYDYQFIAMGVFLTNYFFPDLDKMEGIHRDWLLDNCNCGDLMNAPDKFVGFEAIIAGYLIALKASNRGITDIDFVIEKSEKVKVQNRMDKFLMIYAALYFIGLFESKSDRYFFVASASELFKELENIAWLLANGNDFDNKLDNAFEKVKGAIAEPKRNARDYYITKNPAIKHRTFLEYENSLSSLDEDKVYMIYPEQAVGFLEKSGKLNVVRDFFEDKTIVTNDEDIFNLFTDNSIDIAHIRRGVASLPRTILLKNKIVSENRKIQRFIQRYFKRDTEVLSMPLDSDFSTLVLMVEDFKFDKFENNVLERINTDAEIENVVVFNFANRESSQKNKKYKKLKVGSTQLDWINNVTIEKSTGNSGLQSKVETFFKNKNVKIITKYDDSEQWEMVLLGIGALRDVDFNDAQILDFRKMRNNDAYETVARCFRDIIVFDKNQRYMFMNLS